MSVLPKSTSFLEFKKKAHTKADRAYFVWPIEHHKAFLSMAEKNRIDRFLRCNKQEETLLILRKTYRWIQNHEHLLKNVEAAFEHLKAVAKWIQDYPEQAAIAEEDLPQDTSLSALWDWVCESIEETHGLFACESQKQAQQYLKEVEPHLPDGFGIIVIREKELNLYRTTCSSKQNN